MTILILLLPKVCQDDKGIDRCLSYWYLSFETGVPKQRQFEVWALVVT
jgi:hypothetical protein